METDRELFKIRSSGKASTVGAAWKGKILSLSGRLAWRNRRAGRGVRIW